MSAVRGFPMDEAKAKDMGDQITGALQKWERDRNELEEVSKARNGFLGGLSASSMQHTPSMLKMLQLGSQLGGLLAQNDSRENQVEDGDERTVLNTILQVSCYAMTC